MSPPCRSGRWLRREHRARPRRASSERSPAATVPSTRGPPRAGRRSRVPKRSSDTAPMNPTVAPSRPHVRAVLNGAPPSAALTVPSSPITRSTSASPATTITVVIVPGHDPSGTDLARKSGRLAARDQHRLNLEVVSDRHDRAGPARGIRAGRSVPTRERPGVPLRPSGDRQVAARPDPQRPPSRPQHRRVRVRLPGLTGRLPSATRSSARRRTVADLPIVCQPGANEELAATAVMGSQSASTLPDCTYDGVIGMWYAKAPGLDRASDAIRHGVFAGTSEHGGVVALVGDDPGAKSSTLPSSSDATMVDLHMPIFFPGDVQEALDLSRHAVALSRSCGLWAGIKLVSQVADGTGTVDIHPDRVVPQVPTMIFDGKPFVPHPERSLDDALHARHGARVLRGAFRIGPRVRRAQPPQPGDGAQRRRLDRHRRLRHDVLRGARDAPVARARRRRRDPRRRHPPVPAADAGPARAGAGPRVRPRSRRGHRRRGEEPDARAARPRCALRLGRASAGRRAARRPGPAVDPRRRHARRRATDRPALRAPPRGPPRRASRAVARAHRRTFAHRPRRSSGRRSSAAGARTTRAPGSSPARWSAAASGATRWSG